MIASNPTTVFFIDDDCSAQKGLSKFLRVAGFSVESFVFFKEFCEVEHIPSNSCNVIDAWVADFPMENQQTSLVTFSNNFPLLFLSAREDEETVNRALVSKAMGCFRKPIDGAALFDAINWAVKTHGLSTATQKSGGTLGRLP